MAIAIPLITIGWFFLLSLKGCKEVKIADIPIDGSKNWKNMGGTNRRNPSDTIRQRSLSDVWVERFPKPSWMAAINPRLPMTKLPNGRLIIKSEHALPKNLQTTGMYGVSLANRLDDIRLYMLGLPEARERAMTLSIKVSCEIPQQEKLTIQAPVQEKFVPLYEDNIFEIYREVIPLTAGKKRYRINKMPTETDRYALPIQQHFFGLFQYMNLHNTNCKHVN